MIPCPVIMVTCVDVPFVPNLFQTSQVFGLLGGESTRLPQHRFPYFLAPPGGAGLIYLQRLKQNILLGEHDAQEIFQALPVVVGGVHMDVDAAGAVDLPTGMAHLPHTFLKLG